MQWSSVVLAMFCFLIWVCVTQVYAMCDNVSVRGFLWSTLLFYRVCWIKKWTQMLCYFGQGSVSISTLLECGLLLVSDLITQCRLCDILRLQSESYKAFAFPTPVGKLSVGVLSCPIHLMTLRQSCCEQTQATRRSHGQVVWLMVFQSSPVRWKTCKWSCFRFF